MEPTIYPKNIVLVNRMAYRRKPPKRNDIVLIRLKTGTIPAIHRIIGCPNDVLKIENGTVTVNKKEIPFNSLDTIKTKIIKLSIDTYYQKGDNPNTYFDTLHPDHILGKAIYVFGGMKK